MIVRTSRRPASSGGRPPRASTRRAWCFWYNIIHEQELLDAGDQLVAYLAQQAAGGTSPSAVPRGRSRRPAHRITPPPRTTRHRVRGQRVESPVRYKVDRRARKRFKNNVLEAASTDHCAPILERNHRKHHGGITLVVLRGLLAVRVTGRLVGSVLPGAYRSGPPRSPAEHLACLAAVLKPCLSRPVEPSLPSVSPCE